MNIKTYSPSNFSFELTAMNEKYYIISPTLVMDKEPALLIVMSQSINKWNFFLYEHFFISLCMCVFSVGTTWLSTNLFKSGK